MTRARLVLLALLIVVGAAIAFGARAVRRPRESVVVSPELRAPDGTRIRVQVLNSTNVRGLARRATLLLRDRGFDVVEVGTISGKHDSTLVLDLSGHPEWAERVARVMGQARVESRPDSSRYLDISVVLGTSWRPPAQPFYP